MTNFDLLSTNEHYARGWRNGHADKLIGISPLIVALSNPNLDYADGYRAGYHATANEVERAGEDG